jgi:putative transposase
MREILIAWPAPQPEGWVDYVDELQTEAELEAVRRSVRRGQPLGSALWDKRTAERMGLESTFRPIGRLRKASPGTARQQWVLTRS